jgi:hypothetical protein
MKFNTFAKALISGQDFVTDVIFLAGAVLLRPGNPIDGLTVLSILSIISSVANLMGIAVGPALSLIGGSIFPVPYSYINVVLEDGVQIGLTIAFAMKAQALTWHGFLNLLGSILSLYYFFFVDLRNTTEEAIKNQQSETDAVWLEIQALFNNIGNTIPFIMEKHIRPEDRHLFKNFGVLAANKWSKIYDEMLSEKAGVSREYEQCSDPQEKIYVGLSELRAFSDKLHHSYVKSFMLMMPPENRDFMNVSEVESYLNRVSKKENWASVVSDGVAGVDDNVDVEESLMPMISLSCSSFEAYLEKVKSNVSGKYAKLSIVFTVAVLAGLGASLGIAASTYKA